MTELDAGVTFLEVARTTKNEATAQRNREHALEAYQTVQRFLPRVRPDAVQQRTLALKLAALRSQLRESGYEV